MGLTVLESVRKDASDSVIVNLIWYCTAIVSKLIPWYIHHTGQVCDFWTVGDLKICCPMICRGWGRVICPGAYCSTYLTHQG